MIKESIKQLLKTKIKICYNNLSYDKYNNNWLNHDILFKNYSTVIWVYDFINWNYDNISQEDKQKDAWIQYHNKR